MFDLMANRLEWLRREMDQAFQGFYPELAWKVAPAAARAAFPALNVWQDEKNYYAEAELPGVAESDLKVTVHENELVIAGERKPVEREGTWHLRERAFGTFSRTLALPAAIEADKVQATFKNGILTITLPKAEKAQARRIEVKRV